MTTESTPFDFWAKFSDGSDFVEVECDSNENVATDVLDTFNISYSSSDIGGPLTGLDVKQMEAIQAIKLSLLEYSANNGDALFEFTVNPEGEVEFIEIGKSNGLNDCEIYYEFQTGVYQERCSGVMITGRKPLVERKVIEWKDVTENEQTEIYNTGWISTGCNSDRFSQYATIVFTDPHLDSSYNDGIENLYEVISPFENIIGYASYITWPDADASPETTVTKTAQAKIPILVSGDENNDNYNANVGTLQKREPLNVDNLFGGISADCFANTGVSASASDGVLIEIPEKFRYETIRGTIVDKFISVDAIYIVGRELIDIRAIAVNKAQSLLPNESITDADVEINVTDSQDKVFALKEGDHYVIAWDGEPNLERPYVVFADNSRPNDPATYGNDVTYKLNPISSGSDISRTGQATILPTGGTTGYLVKQIFAVVSLQTPSIVVYDPRISTESKAYEIATQLKYYLTPLVTVDQPAPVAFNGRLINLEDGFRDHDPTTSDQDFANTDYENAIEEMGKGGGLTLSFSFLDENQIVALSEKLYEFMNSGDGVVTTYVCGPESEPILGGYGDDSNSIINEINYSYSDSNSYTISVTAGPKIIGDFAQTSGGALDKMVEEFSARGTVIGDLGDHVHFNVEVDGYGPIMAINCAPSVIRVGDKVNVAIHNVPVEN